MQVSDRVMYAFGILMLGIWLFAVYHMSMAIFWYGKALLTGQLGLPSWILGLLAPGLPSRVVYHRNLMFVGGGAFVALGLIDMFLVPFIRRISN